MTSNSKPLNPALIKTQARALLDSKSKKNLMTFGQLEELDLSEPECIIEGLPRRGLGMVAAVTNYGKTTWALNLAVAAACGRPYLNLLKIGPPRKVWYLDWETPIEASREDIRKMASVLTPAE